MPRGNTSGLNIHCFDSEKQTSVFQGGSEKGQYVRFQIIKILTEERKREEKIFSSWKTNLKDSLVELCEKSSLCRGHYGSSSFFIFFLKDPQLKC